jgi:hypothetical protein
MHAYMHSASLSLLKGILITKSWHLPANIPQISPQKLYKKK